MFALLGGPSPSGGSLSLLRVQTGRSRIVPPDSNGSFEAFLGDFYLTLKEKWVQWLATTYSESTVSFLITLR